MAAPVRKLPGARWRRGQGGSRGTRRERGGAGMIKEVRRRFRHPWLAVGPEGGSGGHGMRLSSDEVRLLLVRRLQRSTVSRFLTFELVKVRLF